MRDVVVAGDGPTGLSAALLLAKNGLDVAVVGDDDTRMHNAYLYNYLGVAEVDGSAFVETAREQVAGFGADLVDGRVTAVESVDDDSADGGFRATVEPADGTGAADGAEELASRYLVLATGTDRSLADDLGVELRESDRFHDERVVEVDRRGRTSLDGVYAGGWTTRVYGVQAAISVGDGAAIAVDVLAEETGGPFHDFDAGPK